VAQLRHPSPDRRVLDELAGTLPATTPPWWWRRPRRKTTRVPLRCLTSLGRKNKKIIVLEPRRIAARASAERMAHTIGERVGETVGYRVRFGSKVSRADQNRSRHRGYFSRQISRRAGIVRCRRGAVRRIPERSLDADLGLALARDAQTGLREDLRILVMSATLDARGWQTARRRGR